MGTLARWLGLTITDRVVSGEGDSVVRGTAHGTVGFMAQLRERLGAYFVGNPGNGSNPLFLQAGLDPNDPIYDFLDSPADWSVVGAGSADDKAPYRYAYTRGVVTNATQSISYSKPAGHTVHHFELVYLDVTGSGDIDVSVDGSPYFVVTTAKAHDHGLKRVTVAQHVASTIRVRPHGATTLALVDIFTWSRTSPPQGCAVHNVGKDGAHVYEFDHVAGAGDPMAWHDLVGSDLAVVLWTNDFTVADIGGTPTAVTTGNLAAAVAGFGVHLQAVYDDLDGLGGDVLFLVPYQQNRALGGRNTADDQTIQAAFRAEIIAIANANTHADYVDISASSFGTVAADAIAAGYLATDGLHPTQQGHDLIAELIYSKIVPGATRAPTLKVVPEPRTTADLLDMRDAGTRADGFAFRLLDADRTYKGDLTVDADSPPTVSLDTTRTSFRDCAGLIAYDPPATIDLGRERVQVVMLLQNGDELPLGVFMFGDDSRQPYSWGSRWAPQLVDETFLLDQDLDRAWSLPTGGSVLAFFKSIVGEVLEPLGIPTDYAVGDVEVASPISFAANRVTALNALAALLGCYPPFFSAAGVHTLKPAQVIDANTVADHSYDKGDRIFDDTTTTTSSLWQAPNRYIVIGDALGEGAAVRGIYDLPPAAPHSAANLGYIVRSSRTVSGVPTEALARAIAYTDAVTDRRSYGKATFSGPADPRHGVFDLLELFGGLYLETGWSLDCHNGGPHSHAGTRLWL